MPSKEEKERRKAKKKEITKSASDAIAENDREKSNRAMVALRLYEKYMAEKDAREELANPNRWQKLKARLRAKKKKKKGE
jgi:hypothetical protein